MKYRVSLKNSEQLADWSIHFCQKMTEMMMGVCRFVMVHFTQQMFIELLVNRDLAQNLGA